MSGRGIERHLRGRRRWAGKGSPPPARETREAHKKEGAIPGLPSLKYGASPKENRLIEFLQLMGEYSGCTKEPLVLQIKLLLELTDRYARLLSKLGKVVLHLD
jgi:hypothetical protein